MNEKKKSFVGLISMFIISEWLKGLLDKSKSSQKADEKVHSLLAETGVWVSLYLDSIRILKHANIAARVYTEREKDYVVSLEIPNANRTLLKSKVENTHLVCENLQAKLKQNKVETLKSRNKILELLREIVDMNLDNIKNSNIKILPEAINCVNALKAYDVASKDLFNIVPWTLNHFKEYRNEQITLFFAKARKLVNYYIDIEEKKLALIH